MVDVPLSIRTRVGHISIDSDLQKPYEIISFTGDLQKSLRISVQRECRICAENGCTQVASTVARCWSAGVASSQRHNEIEARECNGGLFIPNGLLHPLAFIVADTRSEDDGGHYSNIITIKLGIVYIFSHVATMIVKYLLGVGLTV